MHKPARPCPCPTQHNILFWFEVSFTVERQGMNKNLRLQYHIVVKVSSGEIGLQSQLSLRSHTHINMASYGAVVQRPSATSANHPSQTQPDESKQLPNFEKNQPFSFQVTCPVSIPTTPESAATRIIKNLGKFGLYYAEFVWIVLFIALIPKRKVSVVYLVAFKEVAVLYLILLRAVANSVLFRWLIAFDTRLIVLPLLAIGTCVALILTNAGIHLVITLAATLPIILAHAVLWIAEDSSFNDETNQESVPFVHTV